MYSSVGIFIKGHHGGVFDQRCEWLFIYDFLAISWHLVQGVRSPLARRQLGYSSPQPPPPVENGWIYCSVLLQPLGDTNRCDI